MSVLDRVRRRAVPRGNARASVLPDIKLHVAEENDSFIADDGSRIWTSGYALLDDTTGSFMRMRDQHFDNRHCLLCRVAGVTYRPEALQDPRFAPGHAVRLIPEPTNPYDQNAAESGTPAATSNSDSCREIKARVWLPICVPELNSLDSSCANSGVARKVRDWGFTSWSFHPERSNSWSSRLTTTDAS